MFQRRLQASFHAVRMARPGLPALAPDLPLLIYGNHPSWWDAALLPVLCRRLFPARRMFAPIDAQALQRYRFMRRLGFFGIDLGSRRGSVAFLRVGGRLLGEADTVFCITPEGTFTDPRRRPLQFRPGLAALIARVPRVTVLPLALEYPFWSERTPEALLRFGEPLVLGTATGHSPGEVPQLLEQALVAAMDRLADDAASRDASRFTTLFEGRVGVGGVYDLWRRGVSRLRGHAFDPAHMPEEPSSSTPALPAARGDLPQHAPSPPLGPPSPATARRAVRG